MSEIVKLFDGGRSNIVEHIKNIYKTKALDGKATCRKFRQVQKEGKRMAEESVNQKRLHDYTTHKQPMT